MKLGQTLEPVMIFRGFQRCGPLIRWCSIFAARSLVRERRLVVRKARLAGVKDTPLDDLRYPLVWKITIVNR